MVARRIGLGGQRYGYLFAAIGVGGLLGTALASAVLAYALVVLRGADDAASAVPSLQPAVASAVPAR